MAPAHTTMTAATTTSVELTPREYSPGAVKKIVLKSCYGKTGHKLRLEPCRDLRTNQWLGVDKLSEEQKRQRGYIVEPGVTYVEIRDGHEFDLTSEKDRLDWQWVQHCPQIAVSRDATNFKISGLEAEDFNSFEGADLEFYVHDEDKDSYVQEKRFELEFEALKYIHEQSISQQVQTARLLGSNMESTKPTELRNFLNSKARKHPEQVLKVKSDPYAKTRLFLFGALDKQIIRKSAGVFYYNDTALGTTDAQVLMWLQEDRNYVLVRAMSLEMYPELTQRPAVSEANNALFEQASTEVVNPPASPIAPAFSGPESSDLEFDDEDPDAVLNGQPNVPVMNPTDDPSVQIVSTTLTPIEAPEQTPAVANIPRAAARRQQQSSR